MTVKEYLDMKDTYYQTDDNELKDECFNEIVGYNIELIFKYPWLYPIDRWTKGRLEDYDYSFTELDEMPNGWRLAFGEQMCDEIQQELEKFDFVEDYSIVQIKEKYGALRWYDGGTPIGKLSDTYIDLYLNAYENRHKYSQYDNMKYSWKEKEVEHYISPFCKKAKSLTKEELQEYNSKAIYHYEVYEIVESCKIHDIICKYEDLSSRTCVVCGKPATLESRIYIKPYCLDCAETIAKNSRIKGATVQGMFIAIDSSVKD